MGLFGKRLFPKVKLAAAVGPFEIKTFPTQQLIKLDFAHGPEAFEHFVVYYVQSRLDYYHSMPGPTAALREAIRSFLDTPTPTWEIVDNVEPENYVLFGGTWHENGIGSTAHATGGPADTDVAIQETAKALLAKTGDGANHVSPRVAQAVRKVLEWNEAHGWCSELSFKHQGPRVARAWSESRL